MSATVDTYVPRLKETYEREIRPALKDELGLDSIMQVPRIEKIVVNDLQEHTFYAKLVIRHQGELVEVDSRPSDAIALGVGGDVPLYVEDHVLDEASTQ